MQAHKLNIFSYPNVYGTQAKGQNVQSKMSRHNKKKWQKYRKYLLVQSASCAVQKFPNSYEYITIVKQTNRKIHISHTFDLV